jgi:hypothetical protein
LILVVAALALSALQRVAVLVVSILNVVDLVMAKLVCGVVLGLR